MAEKRLAQNSTEESQTTSQRLIRVAIGVLFYLILLIPRVRRLRRRTILWTVIRICSGIVGFALVWLYFLGRGPGLLAGGALLIVLGLLVRATPVVKSLEDRARELGALAVLNGGTMVSPPGKPTCRVNIFAGAECLAVENGGRILLEIPLAKIQRCMARPVEAGEGKPWELEISWDSSNPQLARFYFDGFFAEHLARVAESTIANLRRKELTVLK